jgi:ubiquinone/menaquinone biosynthesis C-methylase UbiE
MNARDALRLIAAAVPAGAGGTWADLGAGTGTFTKALVRRLGPGGRIYAVDRDARALASLERWAKSDAPNVTTVVADLADPFELPGLGCAALDGILLANTLHFFADVAGVLGPLASRVRSGGRVVVIEYGRRPASRWVPHPVSIERLATIASAVGLSAPVVVATMRSAFGGHLYAATTERLPL